jgi:hypothetical protein
VIDGEWSGGGPQRLGLDPISAEIAKLELSVDDPDARATLVNDV